MSRLQEDLIQAGCEGTAPHACRDGQGPVSEPGSGPGSFQPSEPRLTLKVTDAGLWPGLQQPTHEELRAKELGGDVSPVLGETDLVRGELTPLWGKQSQQRPRA